MKTFRVTIPGQPHGQGSMTLWTSTDGRGRSRYPSSTIAHRNLAIGLMHEGWGDRPPLTEAVGVDIEIYLSRPKTHYGTGRNATMIKPTAPPHAIVTPDIDKVARLILDALTIAGVIADDRQVVTLTVSKEYVDVGQAATSVNLWPVVEDHL